MKKIILFLTIINIIGLSSCNKDEELSNTELLCRAPWILSASTVNPPFVYEGGTIVDWYAAMYPCEKDDIWHFNECGTYIIDEGTNKCSESANEVYELGIWAFDDHEEYLYTGILEYLNEYAIISLNKNELIMSHISWYDTISSYTFTETYTH